MSGHNRWSKIKHAKAATDAKRSRGWTKVLKELTVAARMGGGDPGTNARLRHAIDNARDQNMPNDTIKRGILKGTGELGAASYEDLTYEVYGPGGSAIVVEILTDNRNRTASEIRKLLERHNGKLAAAGSVLYLFHKQGRIVYDASVGEDKLMEGALEVGATDIRSDGDALLVVTEFGKMLETKKALEAKGLVALHSEVGLYPDLSVHLDGEAAQQAVKLVSLLEEHDDVQAVHSNYDVDDALLDAHADQ